MAEATVDGRPVAVVDPLAADVDDDRRSRSAMSALSGVTPATTDTGVPLTARRASNIHCEQISSKEM